MRNIYNNSRCDDGDAFFERSFHGSGGAEFHLVDADSLEAAKGMEPVLVMNFANAHTLGGGFLNGARAQEESLCRCSTLYASISSDKAGEMYDYNNRMKDPLDSDYMLLSENVAVFRDFNCNPLPEEEIYGVSVVTVPAPNKKGRASHVKQSELDSLKARNFRGSLIRCVLRFFTMRGNYRRSGKCLEGNGKPRRQESDLSSRCVNTDHYVQNFSGG